jgi:hypothetical protein
MLGFGSGVGDGTGDSDGGFSPLEETEEPELEL